MDSTRNISLSNVNWLISLWGWKSYRSSLPSKYDSYPTNFLCYWFDINGAWVVRGSTRKEWMDFPGNLILTFWNPSSPESSWILLSLPLYPSQYHNNLNCICSLFWFQSRAIEANLNLGNILMVKKKKIINVTINIKYLYVLNLQGKISIFSLIQSNDLFP